MSRWDGEMWRTDGMVKWDGKMGRLYRLVLCLSWCCLLVRFAVDDVLAVAVDVVIDIGK
jgi:hypothetical protein